MPTDRLLTASLVIAFAASTQAQTHVYVDDDAQPGGDGLTWQTAFNDLHDAINLARTLGQSRGEIRIAGGTYNPDRGTGDTTMVFVVPTPEPESKYRLVGGYAGLANPTFPNQRDVIQYPSVLDADLLGNDLFGGRERNDNSETVIVIGDQAVGAKPMLSAIVLEDIGFRGAAMQAFRCTTANLGIGLWGCDFQENFGEIGSALYVENASLMLSACTFTMNHAQGSGSHSGLGGALYLTTGRIRTVNCEFHSNTTDSSNGAAIASELSTMEIEDSSFVSNYSGGSGGAVSVKSCAVDMDGASFIDNTSYMNGGAIYTDLSSIVINSSLFERNRSGTGDGGAVFADHGVAAVAAVINYCVFKQNNSAGDGGGLYVTPTRRVDAYGTDFEQNSANSSGGGVSGSGSFERCDFIANTAILNGGGADAGEKSSFRRCVFRSNIADRDGGGLNGDDEVNVWYSDFIENTGRWHGGGAARASEVRYCNIEGNYSSQGGGLAYVGLVSDSEIIENSASRGGGVSSVRQMSVCLVSQNSAPLGSAIHMSTNGETVIADSVIYQSQETGGSLIYKNNSNPFDIVRSTLVRLGSASQPMISIHRGFLWVESSIIWDYVVSEVPTYDYGSSASAVYLQSISQFSNDELIVNEHGSVEFFGTNYDFDPHFINPLEGDLGLKPNSPAIDSGYQETRLYLPHSDVYGDLREPLDDSGVLNTGLGVTTYLDIGAVEFQGASCFADVNSDGNLTPADFSAWVNAYNRSDFIADQNRDGVLTPSDFSAWISNYNTGCP